MPLYIVGGLPRDLVLGRAGTDFDLVVEGDAVALAEALVSKYGGKLTVHGKFGTAKVDIREWKMENSEEDEDHFPATIDLISAGSETYKQPAALPTVKMGKIADDLRRRDFTINALAVRLDADHFGEVRDDFNGQEDLHQGFVRVLHPRSFIDDPTRMLRAVRYEQRYGFQIAPDTLALIPEARGLIDKLSAQRIRHELDLMLEESKAALMLARLADLDLLKPIHAALPWDESVRARFQAEGRPELVDGRVERRTLGWLLWLMSLSEKQIESLNKRLHFTAVLHNALIASSQLLSILSSLIDLKPSQCVERLEELPLSAVYAVYVAVSDGKPKQILEKYLAEWRHVEPKTTGHDLKKLGIPPGPRYQKILSRLRAAWLDGEVHSEAEEQALLEQLSSF